MSGFSVDELYDSAVEFSHTALTAYAEAKPRRTALDAGTALEHLAKACLFQRSPAMLIQLQRGDVHDLARLLALPVLKPPKREHIKTIGLREAVARAELFVDHKGNADQLAALYDLRDGIAHAATGTKVGLQRIVAFVTLADAFLGDLGRPREVFWGGHLEMVDELLNRARTDVEQEVAVAKAAARKRVADRFEDVPQEVRTAMIRAIEPRFTSYDSDIVECPVCGSWGQGHGWSTVHWGDLIEHDPETGRAIHEGEVTFRAESFTCEVCGLRLPSEQHLIAAGLETEWTVSDADPYDYDADGPEYFDDEDAMREWWYEMRQEMRAAQEGESDAI